MIAWHYTHGKSIPSIIAEGLIRPADIGVVTGEKPITWFSTNQHWENTVFKLWVPSDGSPQRTLYMGGLHEKFGIYRIGVTLETARYSWDELKQLSGMPSKAISGLQRVAREYGAQPREWRGTFEPVPRSLWVAIEVFDGHTWIAHNPR